MPWIPGLLIDGRSELFAFEARVLLEPLPRFHDLSRIRCPGQDLSHQRVRIQGDWRD